MASEHRIDTSADGSRRRFLVHGTAVCFSWVGARSAVTAALAADANAGIQAGSSAQTVTIENFATDGKSTGTAEVAKVVKTDTQWQQQLSADAYRVTRREGTEAPFSGKYAKNHAAGLYRCICCDTALFDAATKFESGTGWPSFYKPVSRRNVVETKDNSLGMQRTAVSCRRCDAHLGHVFDDGPQPTGLRYCMNSVALNFVARA